MACSVWGVALGRAGESRQVAHHPLADIQASGEQMRRELANSPGANEEEVEHRCVVRSGRHDDPVLAQHLYGPPSSRDATGGSIVFVLVERVPAVACLESGPPGCPSAAEPPPPMDL